MSYRDRRIASALLRSQYPVVSVDSSLPITNPFTGTVHGQITVLLALGSIQQVHNLQKVKLQQSGGGPAGLGGPGATDLVPERPLHQLEREQIPQDGLQYNYATNNNTVEHIFEVCIDGIKDLAALQTMIWGEADCFVQYHFPTLTNTRTQGGTVFVQQVPTMKTYRTATTLCVPDPTFNEVIRHLISLPEGLPVQKQILAACSGAGGRVGGIVFEVWCRFYHPNVRDQVIAKGTLPLAKLCAMVTMKRQGEANVQTFSIPLTMIPAAGNGGAAASQEEAEALAKLQDSGIMDVTINYKTAVTKNEEGIHIINKTLPGAQVCVSVAITRATGLKGSAVELARHDPGMQYVSEVGVNSYVRVKLSFLSKEEERLTRTVARSFAPEFSYHLDFPCPLLWTDVDSDALSLAEILEHAEACFEVWHQVPTSTYDTDRAYTTQTHDVGPGGKRLIHHAGDVLLGTVNVPLKALLTKKTGISGWHAVHLPADGWRSGAVHDDAALDNDDHGAGSDNDLDQPLPAVTRGLDRVVGGLECVIKFPHQDDLDRVIDSARKIGWSPDFTTHLTDDYADTSSDRSEVIVTVDTLCFPLTAALSAAQRDQQQSVPILHTYVRFKFYDKGAVCSPLYNVTSAGLDYLTAKLNYKKHLTLTNTAPLGWYLNEEKLEIQVWTSQCGDEPQKRRPRHRDRLIGSAYVPLDRLRDASKATCNVSGVYTLFKPGVATLDGACMRCHVTLKRSVQHGTAATTEGADIEQSDSTLSDGAYHSPHILRSHSSSAKRRSTKHRSSADVADIDLDATFPVTISIDRAFHLPFITEQTNSIQRAPNAYVSYLTAFGPELHCSKVVLNSCNPTWNHTEDTRLHHNLLTEHNKTLVFKVWHKPEVDSLLPDKSTDQVLGFVSVDVAPLLAGFSQLAGWYNIMDFHGQCQGQIKVCVTPSEPLNLSKEHLYTAKLGSTQGTVGTIGGGPTCILPASSATNTSFMLPATPFSHCTLPSAAYAATSSMQDSVVEDAPRASLFDKLRKNMEELDEITSKLKQRLQPGVPSAATTSPQQHGATHITTHDSNSTQHSTPAATQRYAAAHITHTVDPLTDDLGCAAKHGMTHPPDTGRRNASDAGLPTSDLHDLGANIPHHDPNIDAAPAVPNVADVLQRALANTLQDTHSAAATSTLLQQLEALHILDTPTPRDGQAATATPRSQDGSDGTQGFTVSKGENTGTLDDDGHNDEVPHHLMAAPVPEGSDGDEELDNSECTLVMPKLLNDVSHTYDSSIDMTVSGVTDNLALGDDFLTTKTSKTSSGMDIPVLDDYDTQQVGEYGLQRRKQHEKYKEDDDANDDDVNAGTRSGAPHEQDSWWSDGPLASQGAKSDHPDRSASAAGGGTTKKSRTWRLNEGYYKGWSDEESLDADDKADEKAEDGDSGSDVERNGRDEGMDGDDDGRSGSDADSEHSTADGDDDDAQQSNQQHRSGGGSNGDINPRPAVDLSCTPEDGDRVHEQHGVSSPSSSLYEDADAGEDVGRMKREDVDHVQEEEGKISDRSHTSSKLTYTIEDDAPQVPAPTKASTLPDFFMPTEALFANLPAAQLAKTTQISSDTKSTAEDAPLSQQASQCVRDIKAKAHPLPKPTHEQTQRIAKIFAARFAPKQ